MKPFHAHAGLVVPLDRPNIDTDQIIPKQFLKRIERNGFGEFLFYDWRYAADGQLNPSFILNEPRYCDATILVAGRNFGCGSSREHAPWALADYGFRAIVAPSFADIFATNCMKNGLLPVVLPEAAVTQLCLQAHERAGYRVTVNLAECIVKDDQGFSASFVMDDFRRTCLMQGLDDIDLILKHEAEIFAYERDRPPRQSLRQNS